MGVFFASDTHFGHKNIIKLADGSRPGSCSEEHDEILIQRWNAKVPKKRSIVFLLGDIAMSKEALQHVGRLHGEIRLILGNHDDLWAGADLPRNVKPMPVSLQHYKRAWLSHCPIHPVEMRNKLCNIHGHVHNKTLEDLSYLNVCMEALPGFAPMALEEMWEIMLRRGIDMRPEALKGF
jgi:calcineurin-like phosphoesterase family protein